MQLAIAQTDPRLADVLANLAAIRAAIRRARGADLVVFPECALAGYGFASREEALPHAEELPGPSTDAIAKSCRDNGCYAIVGMIERVRDALFNTVALVGPSGFEGRYRKMHLPFIGVDRFCTPGDLGFPVFELPFARVGPLICFDLSFPEAARVLKLKGAQLVAVSTNWPEAASISCDFAPFVRAQENHVFVATADRVGTESGFTFRGRSRILDCDAKVVAEASATEPELLRAQIDPSRADRNRVVYRRGEYELDRIAWRRPEEYGEVVRRVRS